MDSQVMDLSVIKDKVLDGEERENGIAEKTDKWYPLRKVITPELGRAIKNSSGVLKVESLEWQQRKEKQEMAAAEKQYKSPGKNKQTKKPTKASRRQNSSSELV